jgi:DNA-binding transcriptional regulator YdaS (Cro superfamily)
MEKEQAIKLAGSARKLAEMLGISRAAISQWGLMIPQARVWQLKSIHPEWFKEKT